ncbi:MAG: SAM-dependent methyltransferase [Candidatus Heimdallarchaeota archaeon]|nr:SAM-dependent methyltransferase [Candidatus Heimdallarchaeota archaeon]
MNKKKDEFGDFQTPQSLTDAICQHFSLKIFPKTIIEPTCGIGNFVLSGLKYFQTLNKIMAYDINENYIQKTVTRVKKLVIGKENCKINIQPANFYQLDWSKILIQAEEPILLIGNLPWITNSELSQFQGLNLPEKANFEKELGIHAIMGNSNFDISEWMISTILDSINQKKTFLIFICKTNVARKILRKIWTENKINVVANIYKINARKLFSIAVDACIFELSISNQLENKSCNVYNNLGNDVIEKWGLHFNKIIRNIDLFLQSYTYYSRKNQEIKWRSGVKHNCRKILELYKKNGQLYNLLGEKVDIEDTYLFPYMKSSCLQKEDVIPRKWIIITQKSPSDNTEHISNVAPKTWDYLIKHEEYFTNRKSRVFKKTKFSIFGVGDYTFKSWKIAISSMYKQIKFVKLGVYEDKPIVLDDTCYFLSFQDEQQADNMLKHLNSSEIHSLLDAMTFWDDKRPIKINTLKHLKLSG